VACPVNQQIINMWPNHTKQYTHTFFWENSSVLVLRTEGRNFTLCLPLPEIFDWKHLGGLWSLIQMSTVIPFDLENQKKVWTFHLVY
jgi:hypothetical protein